MSQVEVTLSTDEVAYHVGIQTRSVCKGCDEGRYPGAVKVKNEWRIPLSSLPAESYASYLISRIGKDAPPPDLAPEDAELLSRRWEKATEKLRERAKVALTALLEVDRLQREGQPMTGPGGIVPYIQEKFSISKSRLYCNINVTKNRQRQYWAALLLPAYDGRNAITTDFPKEAWYYFVKHVKNPGAKIKTAWERTKREAKEQNWGAIPSYDTAKKLWKAVPENVRAYMRGDEKAVKQLSPMVRRDRTTLAINELWSTDSRRLDYWVIDPEGKMGEKGKPFRPWMTAYVEVRIPRPARSAARGYPASPAKSR